MSTFKIIILKRAQSDLADITIYTYERWGNQQMAAYLKTIEGALQTIMETPLLGRIRGDYFMYPVAQHCIFYRVSGSTIRIVRVLHGKMDKMKHLPQ